MGAMRRLRHDVVRLPPVPRRVRKPSAFVQSRHHYWHDTGAQTSAKRPTRAPNTTFAHEHRPPTRAGRGSDANILDRVMLGPPISLPRAAEAARGAVCHRHLSHYSNPFPCGWSAPNYAASSTSQYRSRSLRVDESSIAALSAKRALRSLHRHACTGTKPPTAPRNRRIVRSRRPPDPVHRQTQAFDPQNDQRYHRERCTSLRCPVPGTQDRREMVVVAVLGVRRQTRNPQASQFRSSPTLPIEVQSPRGRRTAEGPDIPEAHGCSPEK
mmetsp:Transcript_24001/g.74340  ORF Transcript_24001/g.74340 Transcript_24001/m.74340 type:complete len:269 (-) Transcript_24001:290-1096(-)